MTISANIGDAKTSLSKLVAAALRGEEVLLARHGRPVVRLQPLEAPQTDQERRRAAFGMFRNAMTDDEINRILREPMTDEELALWYDAPLRSDDVED